MIKMLEIKKKSLFFSQPKSVFSLLKWINKIKSFIEKHHAKWYQFLIWQTFSNHLTWQSINHVNCFCVIKLKYGMQTGPNFRRISYRKCICRFLNKHTQTYTHKMGDSVLQSYLHQQGYCEKWMMQMGMLSKRQESILL